MLYCLPRLLRSPSGGWEDLVHREVKVHFHDAEKDGNVGAGGFLVCVWELFFPPPPPTPPNYPLPPLLPQNRRVAIVACGM